MSEKQNRTADLGRDPVGPLLVRLALPTICAQVVNLLYNIVDRIYIGHIPETGAAALTGMGVTFPVITLISAFAALIGMGGAPRASIAMGAGEHEKAERTLGTCTAALWGLAVALTAVFLLFQRPLLVLFGASPDTLPYAMQYLNIYVLGTIFVMTALGLNGFITAQGRSSVAMKTVLIGAVLNCVLDPIMIFGLLGCPALGTTGAALATVLSQIIAMAIGFFINVKFNHDVHIRLRGFRPDGRILREIVRIGLPAAMQQSLMSVLTVGFNRILMPFSQTAVGFYGIYYKLQNFLFMPIYGLNNALIPMIGYNYGANTHASTSTYKIESKAPKSKGLYTDINGNKATSYGLIAAAEKAGLELYLGSYPITPATDILHELAKHKSLGVKTVQCEDEIAGCASAVGAAFAGALAVTTTSGPGICLKSEAMNLAVIGELPLVIVNVQRGGPSTGLPTKSEQTDLLQALYGRNGESPMPVIAATSPTNCFDAAYMAAKIALEHMTPVVLLTDAFVANGSAAWKLPDLNDYPAINPPYVTPDMAGNWTPYQRNEETGARYWATPGTEGFMHRIGGLEKSNETGAISTEPENHNKMVHLRQAKVDKIADYIPELEVLGDEDADLLIVGWGGTYGHLRLAMDFMREHGKKVAFAHFQYINPLPKNTADVLRKYKKIVVAEQNLGQFAGYLRMKVPGLNISQFNQVKGQPFVTRELIDAFTKLLEE